MAERVKEGKIARTLFVRPKEADIGITISGIAIEIMRIKRRLTKKELPFDAVFPDIKDGKCRMCGKVLTGRQTKWCSKQCGLKAFDVVMMRRGSSTYIRKFIYDRDKGVCAKCGCDTDRLRRVMLRAIESLGWFWKLNPGYWYWHETTGWPVVTSLWEADHILEVVNGGEHTLENLQTLCIKCHKIKTAKLLRKR